MKISRVLFLVVVVMLFLCLPVISHSGRTDSNGGHHSGNSYHYHHGEPAHQHTDVDNDGVLDCPYSSKGVSPIKSNSKTVDIIISLLLIGILLFIVPHVLVLIYIRFIDFFNR